MFDYPPFSVNVYTLETILAEKLRTLIERGKIRDYYDVWRLLKTQKCDKAKVKALFLRKCEAKGVVFEGVDQLFPTGIVDLLKSHLDVGLTRLSSEPLPSIEIILTELKTDISPLLI
jgi:hypothetical protein